MINPELKKRFVDSIEYFRKMDSFQKYSRLSSEEILDRILRGWMEYKYWWERALKFSFYIALKFSFYILYYSVR